MCKAESPQGTASLISMVLMAWKDFGAAHFGPIWSFASDGDAGRWAMVYKEFMTQTIDKTHELYKYLSSLPGLNLYVGDGDSQLISTGNMSSSVSTPIISHSIIVFLMTVCITRYWPTLLYYGRCHGGAHSSQPQIVQEALTPQKPD